MAEIAMNSAALGGNTNGGTEGGLSSMSDLGIPAGRRVRALRNGVYMKPDAAGKCQMAEDIMVLYDMNFSDPGCLANASKETRKSMVSSYKIVVNGWADLRSLREYSVAPITEDDPRTSSPGTFSVARAWDVFLATEGFTGTTPENTLDADRIGMIQATTGLDLSEYMRMVNEGFVQAGVVPRGVSLVGSDGTLTDGTFIPNDVIRIETTWPPAARQAIIVAFFDMTNDEEGNVNVAYLTKACYWSSNHHTKTGGHSADIEDYPELIKKGFEISGAKNAKKFADGAWIEGHLMSTHAVFSQVYSAAALGRDLPGANIQRGSTIEYTKPPWAADVPAVTNDIVLRLKSKPAGTATLDIGSMVMKRLRKMPGGLALKFPVEFGEFQIKCMSIFPDGGDHSMLARAHIGSQFLTGSPCVVNDQLVPDEVSGILVCAISALGFKDTIKKSAFVVANRIADMDQDPWFQMFSEMRRKHTEMLRRMIDSRAMTEAIERWGNTTGACTIGQIDDSFSKNIAIDARIVDLRANQQAIAPPAQDGVVARCLRRAAP